MTAITALLGFTAWTLALVLLSVTWRGVEMLRGKAANSWTRGESIGVPRLVSRIDHAHLNSLENLPVFAVIVLVAHAIGKSALVDAYACWILYSRIAQSSVHLLGTHPLLVLLRATFYFIQVGLFGYLLWGLAT